MNGRRANLVFYGLLTVFLVLAGGYGFYYWQTHKAAEPATNTTTSETTASPNVASSTSSSAQKIISQLKTDVGGTMATLPQATAPHAQVPGFSFFTAPTPKQDAQVAFPRNDADLLAVYKTAQATLISLGMKAANHNQTTDATTMPVVDYTNNNVYCELGKASVTGTQQSISVSCADKADYQATSEKLKPLYEMYIASQATKPTNAPYISDFTVYSSTIQGYAHAEVSIAEAGGQALTALFYQTPDKNWHFFKAAQTTLACTDFNTQELKNAYLGQVCTTTEGTTQKQSTVQ